jgi:hypothetical protein
MRYQLFKITILAAFAGLMAVSCTERIDIELDETYTRLVVDGQITSDPGSRHVVMLSESGSYFYNQPPPPVINAAVHVSDNDGEVVALSEEKPGHYYLPEGYHAVAGKTYTLEIQLEKEISGESYYTASSLTPSIGDTVYIGLQFQPDWGEEGFYVVQCYYWDPPETNFYMFNIFKNDTLLTDTISSKILVDDRFYNGGFTNGIGVGYLNQARPREKLRPGDVITFQACSVSAEYADFVWAVQQEVSFSTPLFSGPPANVTGNLSGGAIGFFATYSVLYASTVFE